MNLNPVLELKTLITVEELGEATKQEIKEHLKEVKSDTELNRYIRRLQAKKLIVANTVNGEKAYKMADIPFNSTIMARVKPNIGNMSKQEADQTFKEYEERMKNAPKLPSTNKYRDYHRFEITFKTLDPILGDRVAEDESSVFPTNGKELLIPPSWWKGWFRSNLYLLNIPEAVPKFRLGYRTESITLPQGKKLDKVQAVIETGLKNYEALPIGTIIKMVVKYPLTGTPITTQEQFENFIHEVSEEPQRGFGANPFYFGGRLQVVNITDKGMVVSSILAK
jgi:hypothetical protein